LILGVGQSAKATTSEHEGSGHWKSGPRGE
jgi:hypothetical protein